MSEEQESDAGLRQAIRVPGPWTLPLYAYGEVLPLQPVARTDAAGRNLDSIDMLSMHGNILATGSGQFPDADGHSMITTQIDRREALGGIAAIFGAALISPLRRAVAAGVDPGMGPQNEIFSDEQRALLDALCERIIPTTDTPGARDAGVTSYIEMVIDEYYEPDERDSLLDDLQAVDGYAREQRQAPFADLAPEQQDDIVSLAEQQQLAGADDDFFETIKQLTVTGYYTSEPGMTVERVYLPAPGRYDGAYPYAEVGRLFTA